MNYVNTHKPTNRTFAVIDGGLNLKASVEPLITTQKPRLLDQVRQAIRTRHYSYRTEKAYVHWIKRYIFFHDKRHPAEMAEFEIGRFLSSLATEGHVSASTQNQAFNALLFLYHEVLDKKIGLIDGVVRAKRPERLPVVLTKDEVKKVIDHITGVPRLMAILLYGAGLRLMECCRLRVKDIDFSRNEIVVRSGKGNKDRYTMLPSAVRDSLVQHLRDVRAQHEADLKRGLAGFHCRMLWTENIPAPVKNGAGNGFFRPPVISPIGSRANSAGIISTNPCCNAHLKKRGSKPEFSNRQGAIHCVIHLRRTCWRTVTIFEPSKNCWGIHPVR